MEWGMGEVFLSSVYMHGQWERRTIPWPLGVRGKFPAEKMNFCAFLASHNTSGQGLVKQ